MLTNPAHRGSISRLTRSFGAHLWLSVTRLLGGARAIPLQRELGMRAPGSLLILMSGRRPQRGRWKLGWRWVWDAQVYRAWKVRPPAASAWRLASGVWRLLTYTQVQVLSAINDLCEIQRQMQLDHLPISWRI
jgi:hypothetical protein